MSASVNRRLAWSMPRGAALVFLVALVFGLLALLWSSRDALMNETEPGVLVVDEADDGGLYLDLKVHWQLSGAGRDARIIARIANGEWRQEIEFVIQPNHDPTLSASHIIEIGFPDTYPGRTVTEVRSLLLKARRQDPGRPLIGAIAQVTDDRFWMVLSALPFDREANLRLLQDLNVFQMNLRFENGDGILAFEKGDSGRRVFEEAFAQWRGPPAAADGGP